ncbi:TPM domain-containing protein [Brasilonema bromeliae]|nr:TPM domain-containing protein [Brasilonema bromeliae]
MDLAHILSPNTEIRLNQIISKLERQNGDEIAVVTVPETSPARTPKAFTTSLFNYWGIAKSSQNNGVLFLVSVNEHRVEIEVGYGVKNILSNSLVNNIIQQEIIPQFKQGNYEDGILAGTQSLVMRLSTHLSDAKVLTPENLIPLALFLLLFIAVVAFCVKFILPPNMLSELRLEIDNTELLVSKIKFEGYDTGGGDGSDSGGSSGGDGGGSSW